MIFRDLVPNLMNLPEIEEELAYQTKRLYRLRKLQRLGKQVEPDMGVVAKREAELDLEVRLRQRGMAEIPS